MRGPGPSGNGQEAHAPTSTSAIADVAAAFVVGAATLATEFAVVRVVAPWFGQSPYVWANAIGVVLLALALGYSVGGRLADRDPWGRSLPYLLSGAGLWLVGASRLGNVLASWLAPLEIGGDRPLPLSLAGSLTAATVLVGPPLAALAAAVPVLVRRSSAQWGAGKAAGVLGAAGSVGSLMGALAAPLAWIPAFGARSAIDASALLLGLAALGFAVLRRRRNEPTSSVPHAHRGPAIRGVRSGGVAAAAFAVGLAVTMAEFTASRALAPRLGASLRVWTAIVSVLLLSLGVGSLVGARWAARSPHAGVRGRAALVTGALWFLILPWILPALAGAFAPTLRAAAGALVVEGGGSLVAAALLFALPSICLGAASPILVHEVATAGTAGRAAGFVLAAGTVGSIAGGYVAPLLALPSLGTTGTLRACGVVCLLAAIAWVSSIRRTATAPAATADSPRTDGVVPPPVRTARWGLVSAVAATAAAVASFLVPAGPLRSDAGQILERETAHQTLRVVAGEPWSPIPGKFPLLWTPAQVPARFLRFDEDAESYQSVRLLKDEAKLLTAGRYYDHLALGAWFEGQPWTLETGDLRVLVVGYCGGTLHRILDLVKPSGRRVHVTGIELDPDVVAVAREHLGPFPEDLTLVTGQDARPIVEALPTDAPFDLILVDAYQRTQYVPFQLATVEFFSACKARLTARGAVGVNVNSPAGLDGPLLRAIASTMAAAMGEDGAVWLIPNVQYPTNVTIWGTPTQRAPRVAADVPEALFTAAFTLDRLLVRHVGRDRALTDDLAPVEQLADEAFFATTAK